MENAETSNQREMKHWVTSKPDLGPSELTTLASLKLVENMLNGQTVGLGDDTAAIWMPQQVDGHNH